MKTHSFLLYILFLLVMGACTSEELAESILTEVGEITEIEAKSLPFDFEGSDSRTVITMGNTSIALPVWAEGDTIGIYPSAGGDQLSFPIIDGIGKNTCLFTGGGWALKASTATTTYTYTAYTPFNRNYYLFRENTALPFSMLGQKQKGNDNTDHLGAYDLQIANGDTPTSGKISFSFQHKIAIVRMDITAPCAASWESITLETDTTFSTNASINLSLAVPTVTPTAKSNSVTLELEDVSTTESNLSIVAYMMMLPVDFTGKTLNMTLRDTENNIYTAPVTFRNPTNIANPRKFGEANPRWISANFKEEDKTPYVTFTANATQTLTMSKAVETLQYSVNGGEWKTLGTTTVTFGGDNGTLRLRGKSAKGTASSPDDYSKIIFGNSIPVACTGDIRTLVDYENYGQANTENARFCYLFRGCESLISAPELPATTLASSCYRGMFYICTSLTQAPELPATTLAESCYYSMFEDCTSLSTAPELPATTLANYCYYYMFRRCTGLITAPELPATDLAPYCYGSMFSGCISLTTAPMLPATTLAEFCYYAMFYDCTKLRQASALPAITLADYCYFAMFHYCTSLVTAPELPAKALADGCYYNMFNSCKNLTLAPILPATTLSVECYSNMFWDCSSLIKAPELPATTLTSFCYSGMFHGCSKLNEVTMLATNISAEDCLSNWLWSVSSTGTFTKANEMKSLPTGSSGIPEGWTIKNYKDDGNVENPVEGEESEW